MLTTPIIYVPVTKQPSDVDYINYLIAAQCDISCVKAADCYSNSEFSVSHDNLTEKCKQVLDHLLSFDE